jgi:fructose-bisphosphate aldolase class II
LHGPRHDVRSANPYQAITSGEEDGGDNTGVDDASLYTQPWKTCETLGKVRFYLFFSRGTSSRVLMWYTYR